MACENFRQPHRLPRDNIIDWASLPNHLLDSICERLFPTGEDFARFSAVCTHWRSVAGENLRQRLPFLLFPGDIGKERRMMITRPRIMGMSELRPPRHETFYGCSYGWWIIGSHAEVCLFHPFSLKTIPFPSFKRSLDSPSMLSITLRGLYRCTGVLSGSPDTNPNAYVLMVIYGLESRLAFIRSGDQDWTYIDHINEGEEPLDSCVSINYCKGLFYALRSGDGEYGLLCIDVKTGLRVEKLSPRSYPRPPHWIMHYLVKSYEKGEEHLLKVLRKLNPNDASTQEFQVYKLGDEDWIEVESLGDAGLFLGQSHSLSWVSTTPRGLQL